MSKQPSLNALWNSAPQTSQHFDPAQVDALPEPARRYLRHAIAPGTILASAVRLRMHGTFRLKKWLPFTAEQVNRADGQFLWKATIRMHGLPITGFDSLVDGKSQMRWKLLGIFPVASGTGLDVTRSAIGRFAGEALWLPSLLVSEGVTWDAPDPAHARVRFSVLGEANELTLNLDETGQVKAVRYQRWGNPDGGAFHFADFGGIAEEERTFGGYTIPTRLRVGWYFRTERFESEGEFFRVTIDEALFR